MKLDATDRAILKVLMQDGRASLRDVADKTSLTTPTVSSHFSRLVKSGLIRKFVPVFDPSALQPGVNAFVTIKASPSQADDVSKKVSRIDEVLGAFMTMGETNVVLRVNCTDTTHLQKLLTERLPKLGIEVASSSLILKTFKDEEPVVLAGEVEIELRCDYCKGEVLSHRPYNIRIGSSYHYFCCRTCRRSFLEKYGKRISRFNAADRTNLRS